ncbi:MAG: Outer rane receptor protein, partial [Bacteroidetes bacterium]|nr:Outer rane receptor protein [Bacteroidota bacterium]
MLRQTHMLLTWCFLVVAFWSAGHSQDEISDQDSTRTYQIDEVVITGTRTYRKIIDVPYSIERIDNSQFKYDKKTSVDNVLGSIPGLFFQNRYGNHDVRISIRGFGSRSNSGIRGVRILMDHIPESEPDGQTRIEAIDFQSIGSIEVVKGNSSSLYTNAPGGVINFINDIGFQRSHVTQFNEFGSFDMRSNGFKAGVRTEDYGFLMTYNYHNAKGYRDHSQDYWHILNTVLETKPSDRTKLLLYGYFVDGLIKLPGSLTKQQFEADPFQTNTRDVGRDAKRITTKGRLGIRFTSLFGNDNSEEIDVTGYATMKYFERTAATYRIINRNGLGASGRYVHRHKLFGLHNEISIGGDLFYQNGPAEEYDNFGGVKGEPLSGLTNEGIANLGGYFQNALTLVADKLDLFLTGRYDKVVFDIKDQNLDVRSDRRRFEDFTPKVALNFKITPTVATYTSYGLSFDSPAANELDNYPISSRPTKSMNPDLKPQKSRSFEIGIKGNFISPDADVFRVVHFEATFFNTKIEDEIVPFEVFGDVFFRNSAKTNRTGIELGTTTDIVQGLVFKGAYTLSDFSYETYIARSIEVDSNGAVVKDKNFGGNVVPSAPKHNLSLSLSYERAIGENFTGFTKVNYIAISGMYTDDENLEKTKGYRLVNLSAGLDMLFGRLNILLSGGVNNLFNKMYVAFVNINSDRKEFYEV